MIKLFLPSIHERNRTLFAVRILKRIILVCLRLNYLRSHMYKSINLLVILPGARFAMSLSSCCGYVMRLYGS